MFFFLVLFAFFSVSSAFYDAECERLPCTKAEFLKRSQFKQYSLGSFSCTRSLIFFNPDGSINSTLTTPDAFETTYNKASGSIDSRSEEFGVFGEEYCNSRGGICVVDKIPGFTDFYAETFDVSVGERGKAASVTQSYEKTKDMRVRRVQHTLSTKPGMNVLFTVLDEEQRVQVVAVNQCTRV